MQEIDARGLSCPQPVIMAKKALGKNKKIIVILDNQAAADNVARLGKNLSGRVTSSREKENIYRITIDCSMEDSAACAAELPPVESAICTKLWTALIKGR